MCNRKKGKVIYDDNQLLFYLGQVASKQEKFQSILAQKRSAKSIDRIVLDIDKAVSAGKFDFDEFVVGLSVKLTEFGYAFEKVVSSAIVPESSLGNFKPIIFMDSSLESLRALAGGQNNIAYQLGCLQHGLPIESTIDQGSGLNVFRVGAVRVFYADYNDRIYIVLIRHKSSGFRSK